MRVRAPGKLLLSGAYAVLSGAPAVVLAVNRYATANLGEIDASPAPEVAAAVSPSPRVDVPDLRDGDDKLGLGSSAAAVVAALGAVFAARGERLDDPSVGARLAQQAWGAHAPVHRGGSGVDIAASVYGGALRFVMGEPPARVCLPDGVRWVAFFSGKGARTSMLRAEVDRLRERSASSFDACIAALADASRRALEAITAGDARRLIAEASHTRAGLERLGRESGAAIVSRDVSVLADLAESDGAAFFPSGAGGGDCALFIGLSEPSPTFSARAALAGYRPLALTLDAIGVCLAA